MSKNGPVAWITGGSSGIGLAVAKRLAAKGYTTVLAARGIVALEQAARSIVEQGLLADHVQMDIERQESVQATFDLIASRYGRLDVLVNSAGYNVAARQWHELNVPEFDGVLAANLSGTFYAVHAALPMMRAQQSGFVVNIASGAGKMVTPFGGVAYTAAKTAVIALTTSINQAEFRNGIRACVISPGEVATPIMQKRVPPPPPEVLERMLKAEDVARVVEFVVEAPPHVSIQDIVMAPTWNRALA